MSYKEDFLKNKELYHYCLYYVLATAFFVIFREPTTYILDRILVQPVFSKISSNPLTDIAFLTSLIIISTLLWKKRDHMWIIKCTAILLIASINHKNIKELYPQNYKQIMTNQICSS